MIATAVRVLCNVCGAPTGEPLYRSGAAGSITSLAKPFSCPTIVYQCPACAHVQTPPLDDIASYYDTNYNVRADSEDADDLYAVRDGVAVYRTEHQAAEALAKLAPATGARILDYGCGKARTLRHMVRARPDLRPSVFDVSAAYAPFWDEFVPRDEQAAYDVPAAWESRFDVVLSFYAMEHVADPRAFLASIRRLLRPGGRVHLVIPNVRRNAGDLIVVDHVNHFMPTSLRLIFTLEGFDEIEIDEESNTAAYVVNARAAACHPEPVEGSATIAPSASSIAPFIEEAQAMAAFWTGARDRIAAFERDVARDRRAAIYGSGFYGAFIASALSDRGTLAYFLDRNPHQQAKRVFDRAVLPPDAIGDDIEVVYAGLNPAGARDIIAGAAPLRQRERTYFFL
ncbi:MAG TPA: class I SAM-dependent methyltransferase [Candidatus Elarobacter sp.]|jgi:SAM-dependent methyltransferase|nr:class I SAM-dependent methyltransferase [Candidatus Elarobacter sp.]